MVSIPVSLDELGNISKAGPIYWRLERALELTEQSFKGENEMGLSEGKSGGLIDQ